MNRVERWLLDLANLLVGGTGLVYAGMKYLMDPLDEWAVVNHPWQPHLQHLHVIVAPLMVFALGLYWKGHVVSKIGAGRGGGRVTGWLLVLQMLPVVLSGYLIQVTVSEGWRTAWVWVHVATGILWIIAWLAHRLRSKNGRHNGTVLEPGGIRDVPRAADRGASSEKQVIDDDPTTDADQDEAADNRHP